MADPERFDADPDPDPTFQADTDPDLDPTFQADTDPDPHPNPFTRVRTFFFKSSTIVSKVFHNLSCVIFSVRMREEG